MHAVRITVLCDECVRIEHSPRGVFSDHRSLFAINAPSGDGALARACNSPASGTWVVSADAGFQPVVVRTPRLELTFAPDGRPPHAGNMRALIAHPAPPRGIEVEQGRVIWTPGARNRHNLGGTLSTLDGLRAAAPLGEGLLARDGWHLVDDSARHVLIHGWASTRASAGLADNTDWYLFAYGDDYEAALRALAVVAGRVPLPRRCALGAWYSRYWPYTSAEFRGVVDEFQVHDFPLDVLVLDMDWHKPGWTGWSWNRELLPDAEELLHWLHARALAVTLNLHPADGVGPHEDQYAAFMHALGKPADGTTIPFDAGDPRYMNALFEQILAPLEHPSDSKSELGRGMSERVVPLKTEAVSSAAILTSSPLLTPHSSLFTSIDFWWVDWQQDRFVRSIPGLTNLRWLNHLFFQHAARTRDAATGHRLRGLSFSRWAGDEGGADAGTEWGAPATGGWGDHRYPIHFSGDAHTGWDMLAFQVSFTATAGNIGCFFWSHDIGGHFGPRLEEATTRWVQFGALSAALRLHSARTESLDRRPWTYEARFCAAMRTAFDLRSRLMPYLYTCARACHDRTLPLLRPMHIAAPRDDRAYHAPTQYLLGDDLLCAPIVTSGVGEQRVAARHVWFPVAVRDHAVSGWFNLTTGERFQPGSEHMLAATIDESSVFARAGALIPMQPRTHRMATEPLRTLILECFPGSPGEVITTDLYEDDGVTDGYLRADFARTVLTATWSAPASGSRELHATITIAPARGTFAGQQPRRSLRLHIGAVARVLRCTVDGDPREWTHDPESAGGTLTIECPERPISDPRSITLAFLPADARAIAIKHRAARLAAALSRPVAPDTFEQALPAALAPDASTSPRDREHLLAIAGGIGLIRAGPEVRIIDSHALLAAATTRVQLIERIGRRESILASPAITWEPSGSGRIGRIAIPPDNPTTPPIGLRRSRLIRLHAALHASPITLDHALDTHIAPLTRFSILGPFPWDWRNAIAEIAEAPERAGADSPDPAATCIGRDGATIAWQPGVPGPKWPVDFRRSLNQRGGLGYAATILRSHVAQQTTLALECGDKLEAFLNGRKVLTLDDHSGHGAREPSIALDLHAGDNTLLVKCSDGGGGWGFLATLDGEHAIDHVPL